MRVEALLVFKGKDRRDGCGSEVEAVKMAVTREPRVNHESRMWRELSSRKPTWDAALRSAQPKHKTSWRVS